MSIAVAYREPKSVINPREEVLIEGPVEAKDIRVFDMNSKLTNFRKPDQQKKALVEISSLPEGMVYLARYRQEIIGYITFHYPDGYSRWSKHPGILELGAIEISPDWRKCGIGVALLKEAFTNPVMDDYIVLTVEFCWHWDLDNSGLGMFEYQRMLTKLFGAAGLYRRATDDPDITEHPANVLMVRVGENVSQNDRDLFENMLFEHK